MTKLLIKEIKLSYLPIVWFMPLLSCLLLIPQYPYCVGVSYCLLNLFINFNYAGSNGDLEYTASLPIPRRDIVKAKVASGAFMELCQMAVAVVCGLLSSFVLWGPNPVGLDANAAYFGLMFLGIALFNIVFFPSYFGRGCRTGVSMLAATAVYAVFICAEEALIATIPSLNAIFDGFDPTYLWARIIVLTAGVVGYAASLVGGYFLAVKKFLKVSL